MNTIVVVKIMVIVEHLISDLYLCRISGYNYCEQQLEDQLFKQYFSHKKYLINNEVIAIITSDWNCHRSGGSTIESGNSSNSIGLLCHHVDVCNTYYYFVDKIVLDDSTVIITNTNGSGNSRVGEDTIIGNSSVSDSNSSGNCYSNNGEITSENTVDKYYTLPTSTNVLLSPPKQVRIYKSVIDKAVEKAVASLYTKHCPKVLAIPVTSCMCSNAPKYLSIDVRKRNCSNSNNVNDSSNSVGDNSSGCCHVNSGCSSSCKHISRYYSEAAKRIISEVGYVQNLDKFSLSIGLELISQPLLLELCSVSHTQGK